MVDSRTVERRRPAALGRLGRCGLVIGSVLLLAACQHAVRLGTVNHCGYPVNVISNEVDSLPDLVEWVWLDDGKRGAVVLMSEGADVLHVWVRRSEDGEILNFVIPVAELPAPPPDAVYDSRGEVEREIVLEGDRCPIRSTSRIDGGGRYVELARAKRAMQKGRCKRGCDAPDRRVRRSHH